jgi:hypothetical protein
MRWDERYRTVDDLPAEAIERRYRHALATLPKPTLSETDAWAQRNMPFGSRMEDHAPSKAEWIRYTDVRQANKKHGKAAMKQAQQRWNGRSG